MDQTKNYYEILGIDENIINYILVGENGTYDIKKMKRRGVDSKNEIIKRAYNDKKTTLENEFNTKMGILKRGELNNSSNPEKLRQIKETMQKLTKQFEESMKELSIAYETIRDEGLRKIYNDELLRKGKNRERPLIDETAYEFFNISEQKLKLRSDTENDLFIEKEFDRKMENYEVALKEENLSFKKRQEIETLILKAKEFYELIATAEKRKTYNKNLDEKEADANKNMHRKKIEAIYSKKKQYDKNLIQTIEKGKLSGEKLVVRKKAERSGYILLPKAQDGCNILIRRTAEIAFKNTTNVNSYVNEYEIIKEIEGEDKVDTIYTMLSLPELGIDEDTGKPVNPRYYECVVNKLLAEDTIEGSKYNGGYIGMIEKTEDGNYDITLDKGELNPIEQENLTAVMIMKEREEKSKGVKREGESK